MVLERSCRGPSYILGAVSVKEARVLFSHVTEQHEALVEHQAYCHRTAIAAADSSVYASLSY